uniref:C-type lectin domain family 2 member H-like n=1 Tax=Myodes glareolus TaxID=447135 RepID=UPI00201FEB81|nr:C-type lectin domain family 2 member H-like [Myodes glareolus]
MSEGLSGLSLSISRNHNDLQEMTEKELQGQCFRIVFPVSPAGLYCCYAVILVLTGAVIALSVALSLSVTKEKVAIESPETDYATCPRDWIGFGSKCFYFSEYTSNWIANSQPNFLNRFKGDSATWIDLHRESSEHPWMWTDNTEYNNLVLTRGNGEYAYLSDSGISSGGNYI